jgi:hypothetical protein
MCCPWGQCPETAAIKILYSVEHHMFSLILILQEFLSEIRIQESTVAGMQETG